MGGYPCTAIRTHDFLFIRNYRPNRWPNGTPNYKRAAMPGNWLADTDNGPTKTYIVENRNKDDLHRRLYDLSFAKRPAEELYDLRKDPEQLNNVVAQSKYAAERRELAGRLQGGLELSDDPRAFGKGDFFDKFPYLGGGPKFPGWKPQRK